LAAVLVLASAAFAPAARAATADQQGDGNQQVTESAAQATPSLTLQKTTNGQDAPTPPGPSINVDDPVTWTYVVTNDGNVPLTNVVVTDDGPGHLDPTPVYKSGDTNNDGILDPGEAWTYEASSVAFWDSRIAGQYANTATATAQYQGQTITATYSSHYAGTLFCPFSGDIVVNIGVPDGTAGILVDRAGQRSQGPLATSIPAGYYQVKLASYDDHIVKGGQNQFEEQYAVQLDGAGGTLYTSPLISDIPEEAGIVAETVDPMMYLAEPATSLTALHSSLVGTSNSVNSLIALCAAFDVLTPQISIEKFTNGENADAAPGPSITVGDPVTWTYVVKNVGGVDLTNVVVTDDQGVTPVKIPDGPDNVLSPGESWTYEATGIATEGQYANLGTVTATGPHGEKVTDTDPSHYVGVLPPAPSISIEKATNGQDADQPTGPSITVGDTVTWTYVVKNTGNVDLTNVAVTDDQGVTPSYVSGDDGDGILNPGESWTYTASGTAVEGQYANVGKVTADVPATEGSVSATDPSHYIGVPAKVPAIDIEKTLTNEVVHPGDTATFQIVVTNTGETDLTDVTVTDELAPSCDRTIGDLAMGASTTYTCDVPDVKASFTNVADVVGLGPNEEEVTATDDAPVTVVAASGIIGDTVWHDVNRNGKQDPGEKGIGGAKVKLTNLDTNEVSYKTTNNDGKYLFSALPAGKYRVELVMSSVSGELTTPGVFTPTLAEGEASLDNDFGLADALPKTGLDTDVLLAIALVLLGTGGALLLVTRRREDEV